MKKGTLVLTPFPFTDLAGQKNRPALVLALSRRGEDVILAFISSVIRTFEETDLLIVREHPDFAETGLKRNSVIKLDKLATVSQKIVLGSLGVLSGELLDKVDEKLRRVFDLKAGRAFPRLRNLPLTLPLEGAIRLELQEGVPILRSSNSVREHVESLIHKQQEAELTEKEAEELKRYEEIDDYLSLLNRVVRNLQQAPSA